MGTAGKAVSAGHTPQRHIAIVPHTHWDREWYQPFQTLPAAAGRPARRAPPPARARPGLRPLPARRADGGGRRLPRGAARGRGRARAAWPRRGRLSMGPWYILHGRVPRLGRDDRARPAARPRAGGRLRRARWRSATCPTCSATSPRCPSCCARPGSSTRSCGGACPRPSTAPASGGRRPTARRCGPSTCRRLRQRRRDPRRRQGAGRAASRDHDDELGDALPAGAPLLWMNGTDHQVPQPWLGPGGGRGQRRSRTTTSSSSTSLAEYLPTAPDRRPARVDGRAALGRAGQPADGRGVEPGRREAGRGAAPSAPLERLAEPLCALFLPPERWPGAPARRGVARGHPQRRPRLDLRLLGRRGGRRGAAPLRRGPPDRRRPGRPGARGLHALARRGGPRRRQRLVPAPGRHGGGGDRRRRGTRGGPGAARRARCLRHPPRHGAAHPRRRHGAHHLGHAPQRGARSTPTPGSRTCTSRRTSPGSTSPSPSGARSASTSPSRRSSRTSHAPRRPARLRRAHQDRPAPRAPGAGPGG